MIPGFAKTIADVRHPGLRLAHPRLDFRQDAGCLLVQHFLFFVLREVVVEKNTLRGNFAGELCCSRFVQRHDPVKTGPGFLFQHVGADDEGLKNIGLDIIPAEELEQRRVLHRPNQVGVLPVGKAYISAAFIRPDLLGLLRRGIVFIGDVAYGQGAGAADGIIFRSIIFQGQRIGRAFDVPVKRQRRGAQ